MPIHSIARISPRTAWLRVVFAAMLAAATAGILELYFSHTVCALVGWDLGGLCVLAMTWSVIATASPAETHARAAGQDPGERFVYFLVLITSAVSLFSAVALAHNARIVPDSELPLLPYLSLITVAVSWAMTHTAFTLRYAHLYYRDDDEGVGGIEFPGTPEASYFDFAYFAFTLGMCFQVSDAVVASTQIRRTVLPHSLLSFTYNTAILALALNVAFGTL